MNNTIRVPYDDMKFHYVTGFYDYPLSGTCIHNGQIALFEGQDETDYQLMNDTNLHHSLLQLLCF